MKSKLLLMALLLFNISAASAKSASTVHDASIVSAHAVAKVLPRTSSTAQFLNFENNMDGAKSLSATRSATIYPILTQEEQYVGQIDMLNEQGEAIDRRMEELLVESVDCCDKVKQAQIKIHVQNLYAQLELIDKKINRLRSLISQ